MAIRFWNSLKKKKKKKGINYSIYYKDHSFWQFICLFERVLNS